MTRISISDVQLQVNQLRSEIKELKRDVTALQRQSPARTSVKSDLEESDSEQSDLDQSDEAVEKYLLHHMAHKSGKASSLLKGVQWNRSRKLEGIEWSPHTGWVYRSSEYYKRRSEPLFDHPVLLWIPDQNGVWWVYRVEDVRTKNVLAVIERHWRALRQVEGWCTDLDKEATKQLCRKVEARVQSESCVLKYLQCRGRGEWEAVLVEDVTENTVA
jgi:hypothetical protein